MVVLAVGAVLARFASVSDHQFVDGAVISEHVATVLVELGRADAFDAIEIMVGFTLDDFGMFDQAAGVGGGPLGVARQVGAGPVLRDLVAVRCDGLVATGPDVDVLQAALAGVIATQILSVCEGRGGADVDAVPAGVFHKRQGEPRDALVHARGGHGLVVHEAHLPVGQVAAWDADHLQLAAL